MPGHREDPILSETSREKSLIDGWQMPVIAGRAVGGKLEGGKHVSPEAEQLCNIPILIVEARDTKGGLLGFDRTQELRTQPAREIAAIAQQFGHPPIDGGV